MICKSNIVLILLILPSTSSAVSVGAFSSAPQLGRAAFLGTTITSISDEASTLYWNPAGLSRLRNRHIIGLSSSDLYNNIGLTKVLFSYVYSQIDWGVGVSFDKLSTENIKVRDSQGRLNGSLSYSENRLVVSSSIRVPEISMPLISGTKLGISIEVLNTTDTFVSNEIGARLGVLRLIKFGNLQIRNGLLIKRYLGDLYRNNDAIIYSIAFSREQFIQANNTLLGAFSFTDDNDEVACGIEFRRDNRITYISIGGSLVLTPDQKATWRSGVDIGILWGNKQQVSKVPVNMSSIYYAYEDIPDLGTSSHMSVINSFGLQVDRQGNRLLPP